MITISSEYLQHTCEYQIEFNSKFTTHHAVFYISNVKLKNLKKKLKTRVRSTPFPHNEDADLIVNIDGYSFPWTYTYSGFTMKKFIGFIHNHRFFKLTSALSKNGEI